MQRRWYQLLLLTRPIFFSSRPIRRFVRRFVSGIWLLSVTADGATLSIQQSGDNNYLVSWPSSISAAYSVYSTTDLLHLAAP
jgi:hypothetical protein